MTIPDVKGKHQMLSTAPIEALRRFTRVQQARPPLERCELCSEAIPPEHHHLLDLSNRALVCSCLACSLLFSEERTGGEKYRLVPDRHLLLTDFQMSDEQWDNLMIPVGMVYIFHNTTAQRIMAFYPSPAGATESLLSLENWQTLVDNNPCLKDMKPDVEALLINRVENMQEYYIVPLDRCYQLVGLIRTSWHGLSGGEEARNAIATFYADIRAKARPLEGGHDARA